MEGEVSGIILAVAFGLAAIWCAMLMLRIWRAGSAGSRPPHDT